MSANTDQKATPLDTVKLLAALALVIGGAVFFQMYKGPDVIRVIGLLASLVAAGFVAFTTFKGKQVVGFIKDARIEVRKVVWPTRQETIQTTIVVFIMVTVVSIILALMDWMLAGLIQVLTGVK